MPINKFLFHCGPQHFPGHDVTIPFFLQVEYEYQIHYNNVSFIRVLNIEMSFTALSALKLSYNLAKEIEIAARQHLTQTLVEPFHKVMSKMPDVANEIEQELNK